MVLLVLDTNSECICVIFPGCRWSVFVHKCYFVGMSCMRMSDSMCTVPCTETISQSQCVILG